LPSVIWNTAVANSDQGRKEGCLPLSPDVFVRKTTYSFLRRKLPGRNGENRVVARNDHPQF